MGEKIAIAKNIKASDFEWGAASSHGDDAYAITIGGCGVSYENYRIYGFKADVANTGAATLNINGIGAVAIKKGGSDLETGDIEAGQIVIVIFDGTYFQKVQGGLTQIAQTIHGAKTIVDLATFQTIPALPASDPTTDNQAVRKLYVDNQTTNVYLGSQNLTNGANTITAGYQATWRCAIITLHLYDSGGSGYTYISGDVIIYKTGKNVGYLGVWVSSSFTEISVTVSGTTITIARVQGFATACGSGTIYYYK